MTDSLDPTGDRSALAAEYALGLLDGQELAAALALIDGDPAFRDEVARWRGHLAPLLDAVEDRAPPPSARAALLAAIDSTPPAAANDDMPALQRQVARWRAASGGFGAIAAALALILVARPQGAPVSTEPATADRPPMVAMIEAAAGPERMVASWDADDGMLMVIPAVAGTADPGHSHELWLIGAAGVPRSMGVMPAGPMRMRVDPALAGEMRDGATLAVSLEPIGGSTTGAPTGPVIASGKLSRV